MYRAALIGLLLLSTSVPVLAQQPQERQAGRFGMVIMYPDAIGVIFNASHTASLKADIGFSTSSNDFTVQDSESTSRTTSVEIGIGTLFYLYSVGDARLYLSPRFEYGRSINSHPTSEVTTQSYGGVGSIGVQYEFNRRVAAFAEGGVSYAHQKTRLSTSVDVTSTWRARVSLGVLFCF
jgi:hypothetical protein